MDQEEKREEKDDLADLFGESSSDEEEPVAPSLKLLPEPTRDSQSSLPPRESSQSPLPPRESQSPLPPVAPIPKSQSVSLPLLDPLDPTDQLYLVKLPGFLHIEPSPFDPSTFDPETLGDGQHPENTIRWMYDREVGA
jgi:RNA polymerase-associated protein LEO1